jgi:hypothetical protein
VSNYTAHITRDDKWWLIKVTGIDGLSQARRLSDAKNNARELIAAATGKSLDTIDVTVEVESVGTVKIAKRLAIVVDKRHRAAELDAAAATAARALATDLAAQGIALRDIGTLLGVSFQRAHQLTNA